MFAIISILAVLATRPTTAPAVAPSIQAATQPATAPSSQAAVAFPAELLTDVEKILAEVNAIATKNPTWWDWFWRVLPIGISTCAFFLAIAAFIVAYRNYKLGRHPAVVFEEVTAWSHVVGPDDALKMETNLRIMLHCIGSDIYGVEVYLELDPPCRDEPIRIYASPTRPLIGPFKIGQFHTFDIMANDLPPVGTDRTFDIKAAARESLSIVVYTCERLYLVGRLPEKKFSQALNDLLNPRIVSVVKTGTPNSQTYTYTHADGRKTRGTGTSDRHG